MSLCFHCLFPSLRWLLTDYTGPFVAGVKDLLRCLLAPRTSFIAPAAERGTAFADECQTMTGVARYPPVVMRYRTRPTSLTRFTGDYQILTVTTLKQRLLEG